MTAPFFKAPARKAHMAKALMIGAVLALSGCATALPTVQVTRFHLNQPIAPGAVRVEPFVADDSMEFQTYASAVQGELTRLGFPAAGADGGQYAAVIHVTRDTREAMARRSPVSVGIGGGGGSYGGGVGVGVGITLGGRPKGSVVTELRVQLKRRAGGDVVWEGRAQLDARENAPAAQPGIAAGKLAAGLFRDFPGESGRTITVK
ncbi:hypothetical protein [Sphingomonas colocasiae]|nr:hypothetical protein [Sphingomonas colocasiae]